MVHTRPLLPAGHGEVVERPEREQWGALFEANRAKAAQWDFLVAGVPVQRYRQEVRSVLLAAAERFSARLAVDVRPVSDPQAPIVMTGHQPELYHPGVWIKDFELERLARLLGCAAVDLVVDSDSFDHVSLTAPCVVPQVTRCRQYLAVGAAGTSYAMAPVPEPAHIAQFCDATQAALETLKAPAIARHFSAFCEHLDSARPDARNLAELVTIARRRYEASADTGYLEVMLTEVCRTVEFNGFVVELALGASSFADAYNTELSAYRERTRTRSSAQPFPDLGVRDGAYELPLWLIDPRRRVPIWARPRGDGVDLLAEGEVVVSLPCDARLATRALASSGLLLAPKALALTLFVRLFCCDLFIHGIGGARYDQVTDGVIRHYFGVDPPAFVVASMTMYLPLGARLVGPEDIARAKDRLHRLTHNPDALLGEVDFDDAGERAHIMELVERKQDLVARIGQPDADRKSLGIAIKALNTELAARLEPVRQVLVDEMAELESQYAASEVLTDRTYPLCFWDPREIADKVW